MNHVNVVLLREDTGGCKLLVSHTELGGFAERRQHHLCLREVCPATPTRHRAAPRGAGMKLAGQQLLLPVCAQSRTGTVLQWLPGSQSPSHAPLAMAYWDTATNQPAGFFWCFRVSFHSPLVKAQDAGRLPSSQRLLPPGATLLAVYSNHLRCLQPHLPHFCDVSEPWLSGLGTDRAQVDWRRCSMSYSPKYSLWTSLGGRLPSHTESSHLCPIHLLQ